MTSIQTGSTLTQQLYSRLFDRLNANNDGAVSVDEMEALVGAGGGGLDARKVFEVLDTDGDKVITRAEMTPSQSFGADMVSALLQAQEANGQAAQGDWKAQGEKDVADLFARADTNGDGLLSRDEMDAERAVRLSNSVDAGYGAKTVFLARDADGDGMLRPDEVVAGRMLMLPASALQSAKIERAPPALPLDPTRQTAPTEPVSQEEIERLRAQLEADRQERSSGPEGSWRYLTRELAGLNEQAQQATLTDSLAARLLKQIQNHWTAAEATPATASVTA